MPLILFALIAIAFFSRKPPQSARLPDGTELMLRNVKLGMTNGFTHGNDIENLFGRLIPTNGISLPRIKLLRPDVDTYGGYDVPCLTFEFELTGSGNALSASSLFRNSRDRLYRFVHWGDDGFQFTEEFPQWYFRRRRDGFFGYLTTSTFCRSGSLLHIQLQARDNPDEDDWRTLASFSIPHPQPASVEYWKTRPYPVVKTIDDLKIVLGEVRVQRPKDGASPYHDIWQHVVRFPFQFFWKGQSVTNWSVEQMAVRDSTGNYNRFGAFKQITNGWIVFRAWRSATPTVPWKMSGHVTQDSGFTASNVFIIEIPLPPKVPINTNLSGVPITLDFVNGNMLAVNIPTNTPDRRIVFLEALNEDGESLDARTGSWSQHSFWRSLDLRKAKTLIRTKLALAQDIPFEFTVQPILVDDISTPETDLDSIQSSVIKR